MRLMKTKGCRRKMHKDSCALCGFTDDDPALFGEKVKLDKVPFSVHYLCLLTACGLYQRVAEDEGVFGFLEDDIAKERKRSGKLPCSVCKKKGACVGCFIPHCRKKVHFPCGRKQGFVSQFTDIFPTYCSDHAPTQSLSPGLNLSLPQSCSVCLDQISPVLSYETLKCPSCHSSWFHRDCVQRQAHSSGLFFFRCTLCNNKDQFQQEMLRMGIHIPERDASWELESGAFSELLEVYSHCDAENCVCAEGRTHSAKTGYLEIIRCRLCGSRGTHRKCSGLRLEIKDWACPDCAQAVDGKPALMASPNVRQRRSLSLNRFSSPPLSPVHNKRSCVSGALSPEVSARDLLRALLSKPRPLQPDPSPQSELLPQPVRRRGRPPGSRSSPRPSPRFTRLRPRELRLHPYCQKLRPRDHKLRLLSENLRPATVALYRFDEIPPNASSSPLMDRPRPPADNLRPLLDRPRPLVDSPCPPADSLCPLLDRPHPLADSPQHFPNRPCPLVDSPRPLVDRPRPLADRPRPLADRPRPLVDRPRPLADSPQPFPDSPSPLEDCPCPLVDRLRPLVDSRRPLEDCPSPLVDRLRPHSPQSSTKTPQRSLVEVEGEAALSAALELLRQPDFDPTREISVRFRDSGTRLPISPGGGEAPEAPEASETSRQLFLRLLLTQIQNCEAFEGPEGCKNLALSAQALKDDLYFEVGALLALILVHEAPALRFFSPALFQLLFNFPQNQGLTLEHLTPGSPLWGTITKIQAASSESELSEILDSCSDHLTLSGCSRPIRNLEERAALVDDLIAFTMITRMQLPLQRFREGLQTLGVFEQVQLYPSAFLPLFTATNENQEESVVQIPE